MFRVDADDTDDSFEGVSTSSVENSKCSGIAFYVAAVISITRRCVAFAHANNIVGKISISDLHSSKDDVTCKLATSTSVASIQRARHFSIAKPRQCSLWDIPDRVIAEDYHNSKSTSTTTQSTSASYDDMLQYSYSSDYEDDHMHAVESISTASYSPKNWKSTVIGRSTNVTAPDGRKHYSNISNFELVQPTPNTTSKITGNRYSNVRCRSVRRNGKISKASARILELPEISNSIPHVIVALTTVIILLITIHEDLLALSKSYRMIRMMGRWLMIIIYMCI